MNKIMYCQRDDLKSERELWIDAVKGIAIILVVVGHTISGFTNREMIIDAASDVLLDINNLIYSFHMPLFIFLSGLLFRKAAIGNINKIYKKVINMMIIYFVYSIIYIIIRLIFSSLMISDVNVRQILFLPFVPIGPYWYLWVMMIYYVVFGLMYKKINKIFLFAIVTAISLLANLVQNAMKVNMPDQIYKLLYLSIFFYTGIIAEKYIVKLKLAHSIMCGVIGLTMGGYFGREDYIESIPIVNVIIAWLMICSFVGIAKNSNINIRLLIYYGKNSLPIYLLHLFFVTSVTVVMHKIGMGGIVGLIITVLIGINGSISIMCCAKKVGIYEILFTPGKVLLK